MEIVPIIMINIEMTIAVTGLLIKTSDIILFYLFRAATTISVARFAPLFFQQLLHRSVHLLYRLQQSGHQSLVLR